MSFSTIYFFFLINLPKSWLWLNSRLPPGKAITLEFQRYLSKLAVLRFCPRHNHFLGENSLSEYSADFIKSPLWGCAQILWGVWFSWTFEWLTYCHARLCKVNFKALCTSICKRKVKPTHKSVLEGLYCCGTYLVYHKIPTSSSQYLPSYSWTLQFKIISKNLVIQTINICYKNLKSAHKNNHKKETYDFIVNVWTT